MKLSISSITEDDVFVLQISENRSGIYTFLFQMFRNCKKVTALRRGRI